MRKILFTMVLILLIVLTSVVIYKGTNLGDIWGITQISAKNDELENKNEELSKLVGTTYPNAVTKLNTSSEKLQQTKKEYEQQAVLVSGSKYYNETEKYKIEFLLTKFGDYKKDNNVDVKLDVANSGISGLYNLTLSVTGKYSDVAGFIYDLENDSKLGFKVENFSMTAASSTVTNEDKTTTTSNAVTGKFTFKEVGIDIKSLDNSTGTKNVTTKDTNTNTTNTTSTTNTTNTTSATDTTNSNAGTSVETENSTTEENVEQ